MKALILVDIQNDFLPGGALAVPRGDEVVAVANQLARRFEIVVATRDHHPAGHQSFASSHPGHAVGELASLEGLDGPTQVLWPDHCVQGTRGAELASALDPRPVTQVFFKGEDPAIDSYSAFFDNGHRRSTGLGDWLRGRGVTEVWVLGLATDYCVKFTALDARALGFDTVLVADGCRAVDLAPGDGDRAIEELRAAGVRVARSDGASAMV